MKLSKELSDVKKEILRQTLNDWWIKEIIPEEQLQARVVLIFKKRRLQQMGKLPTDLPTQLSIQNHRRNFTTNHHQNNRLVFTRSTIPFQKKRNQQPKPYI